MWGRLVVTIVLAAGYGLIAGAPDRKLTEPISAKSITLPRETRTVGETAESITRQAGILVEVAPALRPKSVTIGFDMVPFWLALDRLAGESGGRIAINGRGTTVSLVEAAGRPVPASVNGPFRVAVKQIESRRDFEAGRHDTDLTLDIHWEPRIPVVRIDAQPTITTVVDDVRGKVEIPSAASKAAPLGYRHTATVRVPDIPRKATTLTKLEGSFVVTAAPYVLPFTFANLTSPSPGTLPAEIDAVGVTAKLVRFEKVGDRWEAEVAATYPPSHPEFESFESWTANNRARLIGPDGSTTLAPTDSEINEIGRTATGIYRFRTSDLPRGPAGWKLVYETPAALREYAVRFSLTEIPLP